MYIDDNSGLVKFDTRDLMRAASCEHCTRLAIARTLSPQVAAELAAWVPDEAPTLAMKYGMAYEDALIAELLESLGPDLVRQPAIANSPSATIELMAAGAAVIYQGALRQEYAPLLLSVRPDFLVRADYDLVFRDGKLTAEQDPDRSGEGYIVWDAKFGSTAKPAYLLQVALYVDALERIGYKAEGARHGLVLGDRSLALFEESEIVPAMLLARDSLAEQVLQAQNDFDSGRTAPWDWAALAKHCPTMDGCKICEYPDLCEADRVAVDDLVRVANINRSQIAKLREVGITTMRGLASATDAQAPSKLALAAFQKLRRQASLQVVVEDASDSDGKFDPSKVQGFILSPKPALEFLPPASEGDVFFDMEGFPYYEQRGGLEYLFGNLTPEGEFIPFWAHNREAEKSAFCEFIDWLVARLKAHPDAHVYHYASYEVTALGRLANRHGVREAEVAWLLSERKLIDLYNVVRNSLTIGAVSYSIKKLEPFYGFERKADVKNASSSIDEYDRWRELRNVAEDTSLPAETREAADVESQGLFKALADYNKEDVESTLALYKWLLGMPGASSRFGEGGGDDPKADGSSTPTKSELELQELERATAALFASVENWPWGNSAELDYNAKIWLALTHSILFYKREEVIFWRDLMIRIEGPDEALASDREALICGDVRVLSSQAIKNPNGEDRVKIVYAMQRDVNALWMPSEGDEIVVRFYWAGEQRYEFARVQEATVDSVRFERTALPFRADAEPSAILKFERFFTQHKQAALKESAESLTTHWGSPSEPAPDDSAIMCLLLRRPPRLINGAVLPEPDQNDYLPAISKAIASLDRSTLAIQGPPGSGKTYLASRSIAALVAAGKSVAVVANSHSAIENVLHGCIAAKVEPSKIIQKPATDDKQPKLWQVGDYKKISNLRGVRRGSGYVVGATSFAFSHPSLLEENFDYLFIDEAAQFSLVDAMAIGGNATNIVLLGDPQQLAQVVQAVHPGGVDNSALGHYMGEHEILPPELGYFVAVTRRLHPEVNAPVSWLSYQGKLVAHDSTTGHLVANQPPGLIRVAVHHEGNSVHSPEEVDRVLELVAAQRKHLPAKEILIVAPYNAQVDAIRAALDAKGHQEVQVGTVDKFQGREAMTVIVSFAASSSLDAPRGLEFLLDRNRLNVAISRAKANVYLVYCPGLIRSQFTSAADLKAVSRLFGLLAFARDIDD